jgi:TonB family protein
MLKLDAFSLTNTAPVAFEGVYTDYYELGIKRSSSTYSKNVKTGESYNYYPNGKLYRVLHFPPNGDRDSELMDKFLITANYDSLGTVQVEKGNGYYKGYDADFAYVAEYGKISNSKKDSTWKGEDRKMNITFTETYDKGILVSGSSVRDGQAFTYTASHKAPEFKGGEQAFACFLSKNIVYPKYARKNYIQGKVIVTFIIEKNGDVAGIRVLKSVDPVIDDEAVRVLNKSPKWLPGLLRGVPVRVQYSVPISFALQN